MSFKLLRLRQLFRQSFAACSPLFLFSPRAICCPFQEAAHKLTGLWSHLPGTSQHVDIQTASLMSSMSHLAIVVICPELQFYIFHLKLSSPPVSPQLSSPEKGLQPSHNSWQRIDDRNSMSTISQVSFSAVSSLPMILQVWEGYRCS